MRQRNEEATQPQRRDRQKALIKNDEESLDAEMLALEGDGSTQYSGRKSKCMVKEERGQEQMRSQYGSGASLGEHWRACIGTCWTTAVDKT